MPRIVTPDEPSLDLTSSGVQYGPLRATHLYEPAKPLSRSTTNETAYSMSPPPPVDNHPHDAINSDNPDDETAEEKRKRIIREKAAATRRRNKEAERAKQEELVQLREQLRRRDEIILKLLPPGITLQAVLSEQISPSKAATIALLKATVAKDKGSPPNSLKFASPTSLQTPTPTSIQTSVAPSQLQIQRPLPPFSSPVCNPSILTNDTSSTLPPNPFTLPPIRQDPSANLGATLHTISAQQEAIKTFQQTIHQTQIAIGNGQQAIWASLVKIEQRLRSLDSMPVYIDQNAMNGMRNLTVVLEHMANGLEMRGRVMEEHLNKLETLMVLVGAGRGHEEMMMGGGGGKEEYVDHRVERDGLKTASEEN